MDERAKRTRIPDNWQSGDRYERFIGRWSRSVAREFVSWLGVPRGRGWLDVGCGTGALSAAIAERCAPALVVGMERSAGFLPAAKVALAGRAMLLGGDASAMPVRPASVDAVVSGLVLNFVPDADVAVVGMAAVTAPGGTVGAYVWDYSGRMEMLRLFWDAATALDPSAARLDEGPRFPLCRPEALDGTFRSAGLRSVEVAPIDVPTVFADFEDYWLPFLGGTGPAPAYVASLGNAARDRLRQRLRGDLSLRSDGSIALAARAWAVRGIAGG